MLVYPVLLLSQPLLGQLILSLVLRIVIIVQSQAVHLLMITLLLLIYALRVSQNYLKGRGKHHTRHYNCYPLPLLTLERSKRLVNSFCYHLIENKRTKEKKKKKILKFQLTYHNQDHWKQYQDLLHSLIYTLSHLKSR